MENHLPLMKDLKWPVLKTVFRKGRLSHEGIRMQRGFGEVQLNGNDVNTYNDLLNVKSPQPLSFLYLLAQRSQVALMTDDGFVMRIPGLVHLENKLTRLAPIGFSAPFTLEVKAEVEPKEEGSLIPKFHVGFFQDGIEVAFCESTYLLRRKKTGPKKKSPPFVLPEGRDTLLEGCWDVGAEVAGKYARISGDANPIHTHALAARMMGFRGKVMHGWYGVARVVTQIEELIDCEIASIDCQFRAPVILPSRIRYEIWNGGKGEIGFALFSGVDEKLCTTGRVGFSQVD